MKKRANRKLSPMILRLITLVMLGLIAGCGGGSAPEAEPEAEATPEVAQDGGDVAAANEETPAEAPTAEADAEETDTSVAAVAQEMVEKTRSNADASSDGMSRTDALIAALTIFVLAIFVGFELITKVPPTLHTPLMSGSNAISGITLVGAVLLAGNNQSGWAAFFGMLAVIMATVNVVGGFMVTDRMLEMFQKK